MKASEYLSEPVECGGEWTTRGAISKRMLAEGATTREIGFYLIGLDRRAARMVGEQPAWIDVRPLIIG